MKHGLEGQYVIKDNKEMRFGYTTGSCAAAAAQAATEMLMCQKQVPAVKLETPKGITLFLEPIETNWNQEEASCGIRKDAGDDPDVTNGLVVYAQVRRCSRALAQEMIQAYGDPIDEDKALVGLQGGTGIGVVTLPGLEQPIGMSAINKVPRSMIRTQVQAICEKYDYKEGIHVVISAPDAVALAQKTFNPKLGIQGGISILGTSGIVEPMSEQALVATIEVEMKQKALTKDYLLITPGNYGVDYLKGHFPYGPEDAVKCSNYVGQTIDLAVNMGVKGILFVAHIGKFIKVAGGIMNTHSREADSRMEILSACGLRAGINGDQARDILNSVTTDEGLRVLSETQVWDETLEIMMNRIEEHLNHRGQNRLEIGAVVFSNVYGELGRTSKVDELLTKL